jgi:hypothetical protein
MKTMLTIQSFLFGLACMNAYWHPSQVTLGLLPMMALLVAYAFYQARSA